MHRWVAVAAMLLAAGACTTGEPPEPSPAPSPRAASCSASEHSADLIELEELTNAAAATRQKIVEAAVRCDYAALAAVASDEFTFSFGGDGDPAAFWRDQEQRGDRPLEILVGLLDLPPSSEVIGPDEEEVTLFVWPPAFDAKNIPGDLRADLVGLFGEDAIRDVEDLGEYLLARVGITSTGEWVYFVAGD